MKKLFFYTFLIFLVFDFIHSLPEKTEFFYIPTGLSGSGKAYSGNCDTEANANFLINPALGSANPFFSLFLNYGFINDFPYFQGGVSIPIFDVKLSLATRIMGNKNSLIHQDVGNLYTGIIGVSKRVANNFFVGGNFNFSYLQTENFGDIAYTFDTGLVYRFMNLSENENGFCLKNTLLGLTIYGIGKQAVYADRSGIPPLGTRAGIKTTLFDTKNFTAGMGFEFNYNFLLDEYFFTSSIDFKLFRELGVYGGFTLGNKNIGNFSNGFYPLTFGISYGNKIANIPFSIFYSFNPINFNGRQEFTHFLGLEISIPEIDTNTIVELTLGDEKTNYYSFSPNFDKEKDVVSLNINVKTEKLIEHWELIIFDTNGIVKKYRDKTEDEYNIIKLFAKIFEKKENIPIPEEIEWDGISDNGSVLNEGDYFACFLLISDKSTNFSQTNHINLDITPPYGNISLDDIYFSPNNDGFKDTLNIYPSLSKDEWGMKILNKNGNVVYSTNFGNEIPRTIIWDGKSERNIESALYDIIFLGKDDAGNKNILYVNDIFLSTQKYAAYLNLKKEVSFSLSTETYIKPFVIPDNLKTSYWKLSIYNEKNLLINTIEGRELPALIKWNGKDKKGSLVIDGEYFIKLEVIFENGEKASSPIYKLLVDSNPPIATIRPKNIPFSPDDDGENDILELEVNLEDKSGVENFRLNILDPDKRIFKKFSFKNTNIAKIKWNGRSEDGELVESAQNYECEIESVDRLGNRTKKIAGNIPTDILVEKIDRGYKIRINNIEFEFGKYDILPKSIPILKRVSEILKKFQEYEIEIHGHTDNIGSENYNLTLSKKRAESVYNYLVKEGISAKKMKTAGFGFKYPITSNSSEEGRRKNRRVEFILKK